MEGEIGAQIAPPVVMQSMFREAVPAARKRDLSWQNTNFRPNSNNSWNPSHFSWDSASFSVKQSSSEVGNQQNTVLTKNSEEGAENLTLKLGREGHSVVEEERAAVRPSKKVRAGSPGSACGVNYPMCQVDDCKKDLTNAKDYHRRHKVCEVHSKTTKALVGDQMQRFCQQCSRFHLLSEFDEGKRSCRRRLAGHNRRRRKTQPDDTPSRLLSSGNQGISGNNLDIVKLLTIFSRLQGNGAETDKVTSGPLVPEKDQLNSILSKIQSLQPGKPVPKSSVPGGFDLNVSQVSSQPSLEIPTKENGNPSTMDLLAVLSAAVEESGPNAHATLSQASIDNSGDDKARITGAGNDNNSHNQSADVFSSVESARDRCNFQMQFDVSKDPVDDDRTSLNLQLFSSAEDDSPPKSGSTRKYISSESSSLMDERSPSCSPPVAQKFFPLHSVTEVMKHERMKTYMDIAPGETRADHRRITPLDLFKESEMRVGERAVRSPPSPTGYTSSSGSDHSPSSSNSDGQDRTGRIIFKLFDKDPSSFPRELKAQILNWLSNSPSEMESYIRPGCVVLSIYASMPSEAWNKLEENLLNRVSSLVQCSEFWRSGRFLVRTNIQLASHKDGSIRLCKSWKTWGAPELLSVAPIAIVGGQETSFVLKGRNLTAPGTRIHCTYMGGYMSKEATSSAYPGTIYDGSSIESFRFHGGSCNKYGRCFIEVENGFKGNNFPVIVADPVICQELRVLESDFETDGMTCDISEVHVGPRSSRENSLQFLNELGWLFQRKSIQSNAFLTNFSTRRFNFLLTFSVEHDWPALVKLLLDILVERSIINDEALIPESLDMLLEIQLLNRAVKRKCRKMVDLLLHYSVKGSNNSDSKQYLFTPNSAGPGGITPLHLAASTQDSEDIVNALTDDPQEIGLNCWNSLFDESGQSPYMYASMRNNHSYNELVARKLADKRTGQISVLIEDQAAGSKPAKVKSCARCARIDTHRFKPIVRNRGLLHRPYIHSMLAIAAVCVCVCLMMRCLPRLDSIAPFMWENLDFGPQ